MIVSIALCAWLSIILGIVSGHETRGLFIALIVAIAIWAGQWEMNLQVVPWEDGILIARGWGVACILTFHSVSWLVQFVRVGGR